MSSDPLQNTEAAKSEDGDTGHGVNGVVRHQNTKAVQFTSSLLVNLSPLPRSLPKSNGTNQTGETCKDVHEKNINEQSVKKVKVCHYEV